MVVLYLYGSLIQAELRYFADKYVFFYAIVEPGVGDFIGADSTQGMVNIFKCCRRISVI